jgi:hypothetical protein
MAALYVAALGMALLGAACSSIPGVPKSGAGSKLNLATVDYVDTREQEIADSVTRRLTDELPRILDEAIQDERRRISSLETALVAQQGQLAALTTSLDAMEQEVAQLSDMRERVASIEMSNGELLALTRSLSTEVDTLPGDTLRELNAALLAHLAGKSDALANEPAAGSGEGGVTVLEASGPAPAESAAEVGGAPAPAVSAPPPSPEWRDQP